MYAYLARTSRVQSFPRLPPWIGRWRWRAMRSCASLLLSASALIGAPADAGNTYYSYDNKGQLAQKCDARPNNGELAKYSLDSVGNRTNYSNSRTDIALYANQGIYSPSGKFVLWMQSDSNLVLYNITSSGWVPAGWSANTVGSGATVAYFQSDGNLVLYTASGTPVWQSVTYTNPCASIAVTDTGKATITNTSGTIVWSAP